MAVRLSDQIVRRLTVGVDASYVEQPNQEEDLYISGTTYGTDYGSFDTITIRNTSAVGHLNFSRAANYNYILMPADNGTILGIGTATGSENQILIIEKNSTNSVHPGVANSVNLGTSSKAWAQIYGNGIHANVGNKNNAGGLSLYGTAPTTYGIAMRTGAAHGWIMAQQSNANIARALGISTSDATGTDWAINFYNSGSKLRGWKFMVGTTAVASINGYGFMSVNRISLNRSSAEADLTNGRIYWGDASRYDWVDYVSNNAEGAAPTGGKPSSLGNVTNWARRFSFENASGYGWIWETTVNTVATAATTTLTPRMALSSYTGRLQLAPNASSINVKSSGIVISSAENGSNGNVAIELWKGTGTSWQIAAEANTFYLRNNKPRDAAAIDTTSYSTDCFSITNEGDSWFPGEMKIGYKGQQYFRLYAATRGTTSAQGIARIDVGSATANDVAENSRGQVRLYHTNTSYADYQSNGWISDGVLEIFNFQGATSDTANTAAYTTVAIGNAQNVSAANNAHSEGRIYLYSAATNAHIIQGASTTTNYTHYFPNQSGWIAIGGDGSSTGVGSAGLPVYLSTAGVITVCTAGDITTTVDNQRKFVRLAGDTMTGALTVPSIFTVQAQNTTTEGGDICLKKATNGTNDAHLDVYNNLFRIHNDTVARFTIDLAAGGDATFVNGLVKITKNSNTVTIGSTNASYCHIENSADIPFYFNKVIYSNGGFNIYNTGDNVWRNGYLKVNKSDGGDCYIELRRDTKADWRILNSGGNLYIQNNWKTEKTTYFNVVTLNYNTGNANFIGSFDVNRTAYSDGLSFIRLTSNSKIIGIHVGSGGVNRGLYDWTRGMWLAYTDDSNAYFNGNATSATNASYLISNTRMDYGWNGINYFNISAARSTAIKNNQTPYSSATWTHILRFNHANNAGYYTDLAVPFNGNSIWYRRIANGSLQNATYDSNTGWVELLDLINYGSYAVTLTTNQTITGTKSWGTSGAGGQLNGAATNGGINSIRIGDDVWLGDCNQGGMMGMKSTGANTGFYFYNSGGTNTGQFYTNGTNFVCNKPISRAGVSRSWINGRDTAIVRTTSYSGYDAIISMKTTNGAWEMGVYTDNIMYFVYTPDTQYNSGTNNSYNNSVNIRPNGHLYAAAVHSAIWNDYAECRIADTTEPGYCVTETSTGSMTKTTERLMPGCKLISDTYGMLIGETSKAQTPIAISGRVLAYPYRDKNEYKLGAAVCSGPNGTIDIMTREEIMMYPERIIGTVSEIPTYDIWHAGYEGKTEIAVNGRIWIYVK